MRFLTIALAVSSFSAVVSGFGSLLDLSPGPSINRHSHNLLPRKACATGTDNWGNCVEADRATVTIQHSTSDTDDVSAAFLDGLMKANNGGRLYLDKGKKLDGVIKFTDNITYWQANHFAHPFQKSIAFWVWGGKDIKIYGSGTMNGNGQVWYDGFSGREILDDRNAFRRPVLFMTDNATNVEVTGIKFLNSPCWNTFLVRTKNIAFDRCRFDAFSTSNARPKNTDGFDSYNVDGLRVTNTELDIGDDCFSPKSNTTNIFVENLWCNNTHGVSMGSVGQYPGTLDYITNAYIKNVTLLNGQTGTRLKAWAGKDKGYGYIRNITFEDITIQNTDQPVVLDQCYFNVSDEECKKYPSKVNITDVNFTNIRGTSSGKRGRAVVELKCSPGAECSNIQLKNIDIASPAGEAVVICDNVVGSVGIPCVTEEESKEMDKDQGNDIEV